jgi:5-(aminomethyl)-3-furanmethanol phosphate kinase
MTNIRVIKLGGSLLADETWPQQLQTWLAQQLPSLNLMIVGGGDLVDCLRAEQQRFPYAESLMHELAMRCMEINAALVQARCPGMELLQAWPPDFSQLDRQRVYLPLTNRWWDAAVAANRPLPPATWDVTSDSLALWLAQQLQADESVLLKSCLPSGPIAEWSQTGFVDPQFAKLYEFKLAIRAVHLKSPNFAEARILPCDQ